MSTLANTNSVYLPIDTTKYPNGWDQEYPGIYRIKPNGAALVRADSTLSFTVSFGYSGAEISAYAGFACSLAGSNSCTVNGEPVTIPDPGNQNYNLYTPYGVFNQYQEVLHSYIFPYTFRSDGVNVTELVVNFTGFDTSQGSQIWQPGDTTGCLFIVFINDYYDTSNPHLANSYPFNFVSGLQNNEDLRNKLSCAPCPNCGSS